MEVASHEATTDERVLDEKIPTDPMIEKENVDIYIVKNPKLGTRVPKIL